MSYELDMSVNGESSFASFASLREVASALMIFSAECKEMGVRGTYTIESPSSYYMGACW